LLKNRQVDPARRQQLSARWQCQTRKFQITWSRRAVVIGRVQVKRRYMLELVSQAPVLIKEWRHRICRWPAVRKGNPLRICKRKRLASECCTSDDILLNGGLAATVATSWLSSQSHSKTMLYTCTQHLQGKKQATKNSKYSQSCLIAAYTGSTAVPNRTSLGVAGVYAVESGQPLLSRFVFNP
jgi:hypothetical protein